MKTKGITIFEQHVEHAVLGLAVLVFLGLTAMQFVGEPNAVTVGRDTVGPGQVDRMLKERADALALRLTPDAPPPVNIADPQPVLAKFDKERGASISPQVALAPWTASINPVGDYIAPPTTRLFVAAVPRPPYALETMQYIDTIPADVVTENAELQKVLLHQPYDIRFVTAFAKFAAADFLKQLRTAGSNGEVPVPAKWYADRIDFVNVKVERREQLEGNKWSEPTVLDPIPGQLTFRPQLATRIDAATRDQILKITGEPAGRDVYQPAFYSTVREAWMMPGEKKVVTDAGNAEENAIAALKQQIERWTRDRDKLREQMKSDNCSENEPAPPDKTKGGGKGGPNPSGSGGSPSGSRGGGAPAPPGSGISAGAGGQAGGMKSGGAAGEGNENLCKKHRKRLQALNEKIEKAEAELKRLQPDAPEAKPEAPKVEVVQMGDEVMIWAHDINVQPGKTYQYRFTVEVYNPLFAHKPDLMPAQQPLADKFTLVSQPSEWSAPITTEPPLRVFITQASANTVGGLDALPLGSAKAEVFRYFDGQWWKEAFTVQPGMRIGATKTPRPEPRDPKDKDAKDAKDAKPPTPIDYSTDWFVLDVVEDSLADREQQDSNQGAVVLLQSLSAEGVSQVRSPRDDAANQRQFLSEEGLSDRIGSVAIANRAGGGKTD